MKFREYYKLTKITTKNCLKISGVIFTAISAIIYGITETMNRSDSIIEVTIVFFTCFLLGNSFGLFICILAIISGFKQVQSTIHFYNSIPTAIREKFELGLQPKPLNDRYNYLNLQIIGYISNAHLLVFEQLKSINGVQIILMCKFDNNLNLQKRILEIGKKYKKEQIALTGWGLSKRVKKKKWKSITEAEIENYINELFVVSEKEKILKIK
ncbi:MAG: hypothetical protein LBQ28_01825 [Prevotellaceae bacterium]|jgi:hypothetical protein|nr:hypothetical protein [Prevotellaceae bacterium]